MYATDRQTDVHHRLMPPALGAGHNDDDDDDDVKDVHIQVKT